MNSPPTETATSFPRQAKSLPSELVARWTDGQFFYQFAEDGAYYFGSPGTPYAVSASGNTLELNGVTFDRLAGSGTNLEGLWANSGRNQEWRFRADGTYTAHQLNDQSFQGLYETANGLITRLEQRAFVVAENNILTFMPLWNKCEVAAFQRASDELTLMFRSGTYTWQLA